MNTNWKDRPTQIKEFSKDIDYVVAIDESGCADLHEVIRIRDEEMERNVGSLFFTVAACVISMKDISTMRNNLVNLKYKYWNNGLYTYQDKERRVCFHSQEIRKRKNAFSPEVINYENFVADLGTTISKMPFTIYASHINKETLMEKYHHPENPYKLCLEFIFERILMNIEKDANVVVVLESIGKKQDKELLSKILNMLNDGNGYNDYTHFSRIKGVYFNKKWDSDNDEKTSCWMLEIADLCVYPIHKYCIYGTEDPAFKTILPKISKYPDYIGKGLKIFPTKENKKMSFPSLMYLNTGSLGRNTVQL